MRFVFTCGGTAGHINPALSIAEKIKNKLPDSEILFIGAEGQMELDLVPRAGYEIHSLKITGINRGHSLKDVSHNLTTLKYSASSIMKAKSILKCFHPNAVIGTGGYVCFPVLTAAHELNIPTFLHESNAVPGLTTKILSSIVDQLFVGFENSIQYYKSSKNVIFTGTPVRDGFSGLSKTEARYNLGILNDIPLVLSVWGSLGSEHMNNVIHDIIPIFDPSSFKMIHSAGKMYINLFDDLYTYSFPSLSNKSIEIHDYLYDIPSLMIAADLVLCRAGASTLSELAFLGKPAVIVPSPNVTNNHQEKNARLLEAAGAAIVCLENEFTSEEFYRLVSDTVHNQALLDEMSNNMIKIGKSDSAEYISSFILSAL